MREDIHLDLINAEVMDRQTGRPATATIAFTLSYEGQDTPGMVQKTADVLASLFLEENLKVREKQASETFIFLEEEAKKVKTDLEGLEEKIKTFKEQHADALPELLQVNVQNLQRLEMDVERSRSNLKSLEQQQGYLESQLASIPETGLSRKSRLEELKVMLASLTTKFSDEYPDVIKMKAEIAELERMKGDVAPADDKGGTAQPDNPAYINLAAQLASTQSEIASVKQQIKDTLAKVADYNRRIDLTSQVEGEYKTLMNEKNTTELKYNDLIRKTMEARVSQGLEKEQKGGRFTLIDPARLPEKPFKPNRVAIMLIGLVLGVGAGFGMLAVREFIDESVRSVGALAVATSFPILGSIPEIEIEQDRLNKKRKKIATLLIIVVGIVGSVLIFHFLIMDLDIFWAKLVRRWNLLY
jgi:polysaccharide chain length determinant protein (PEP-CTERM system associated)